jgi:hypothetical protein
MIEWTNKRNSGGSTEGDEGTEICKSLCILFLLGISLVNFIALPHTLKLLKEDVPHNF